jgi:hypothetical protein
MMLGNFGECQCIEWILLQDYTLIFLSLFMYFSTIFLFVCVYLCFRDCFWHHQTREITREIEDKLFNLCEDMAPPPPLLSRQQVF